MHYISKPKTIFKQVDEQQEKRLATAAQGQRRVSQMAVNQEAQATEEERIDDRKLMVQLYKIKSKHSNCLNGGCSTSIDR